MYLFYAWVWAGNRNFAEVWPVCAGLFVLIIFMAWCAMRFYDTPVRRYLTERLKNNGLLERDQSVIHKVGKRVHHIAKHGGYAVARDYNAPYGELKLAEGALGEHPHQHELKRIAYI